MNEQVYSGMFVTLPKEVKDRIIKDFSLIKRGATHVVDGIVQSDGYTDDELAKLNVESLQKYTSLESTNLFELWIATVNKVKTDLAPKVEEVKAEKPNVEMDIKIDGEEIKLTGVSKGPGRPRKNA